jgi:hypothetical protein
MAEAFARGGVHSAEELHELGPDAAYARLLANGARPHFIAYYAMVMGLQGRPWNDCQGAEKIALRKRFDALKASAKSSAAKDKGHARLDAALDEIGVIRRRV